MKTFALTLLSVLALALLPSVINGVPLQDDELPFVYKGGGMTVVIQSMDEDASVATGQIYLGSKQPMSFRIQIEEDRWGREVGTGQVQTPAGARPIRSREIDEVSVRVEFESKRYRVKLVADSEIPKPAQGQKDPADRSRRASGGAAPPPAPDGTVILRSEVLKDAAMKNMDSHTLLVPRGWTAEGGAWWTRTEFFNVLPSQDIRVTSPEGIAVHLLPSFSAKDSIPPSTWGQARPKEGTAQGGYPTVYMPNGLAGWSEFVSTRAIPEDHPGASNIKVQNVTIIPELTGVLLKQLQPVFQQIEQNAAMDASIGMRSEADAMVLALECTYTHAGKEWEELRVIPTSYWRNEGQYIGRNTFWAIEGALTFRAPMGQLNSSMTLLKAIADSLQMTPEWFEMRVELQVGLQKIAKDVARTALRESQKRSQIIAQTGREINEIISSGYSNRQAIQDRTHERVINMIRGTEDYAIPGTQDYVQLPSGYDHVYSNNQGEYLLTTDALFDPNTDSGLNSGNWQALSLRN